MIDKHRKHILTRVDRERRKAARVRTERQEIPGIQRNKRILETHIVGCPTDDHIMGAAVVMVLAGRREDEGKDFASWFVIAGDNYLFRMFTQPQRDRRELGFAQVQYQATIEALGKLHKILRNQNVVPTPPLVRFLINVGPLSLQMLGAMEIDPETADQHYKVTRRFGRLPKVLFSHGPYDETAEIMGRLIGEHEEKIVDLTAPGIW